MAEDDTKTTLKERISGFVKDTVTLDVLTLSGTIDLVGAAPADPKKDSMQWDGLFESVVNGMKASDENKLEVVAYTHAEWDMDSVNFVRKDLEPERQGLVDAHHAAVASAQKARFDAVMAVAKLLNVSV